VGLSQAQPDSAFLNCITIEYKESATSHIYNIYYRTQFHAECQSEPVEDFS